MWGERRNEHCVCISKGSIINIPALAGALGRQAGHGQGRWRRLGPGALPGGARGCCAGGTGAVMGRERGASAPRPGVAAEGLCQGGEVTGHFLSKGGGLTRIFGNVAQIQPHPRLFCSSSFFLDSPASLEELSPGDPLLASWSGPGRLH